MASPFLPPVPGCMFPRASDPVIMGTCPCVRCNGTGKTLSDIPGLGLHDVECYQCDGTGTIQSAAEDEQACHSAWIDMVMDQHTPAEQPLIAAPWEVAA